MEREPLPIVSIAGTFLAAAFVSTWAWFKSVGFWAGVATGTVIISPVASQVAIALWTCFYEGPYWLGLTR